MTQPPLQTLLEVELRRTLAPLHLEVRNESAGHRVPPGSETHFRVVVVASSFEGMSRLARHRAVHEAAAPALAAGVHALAIEALTPSAWQDAARSHAQSPPCLGGDGGRRAD
jgi:BolA protein